MNRIDLKIYSQEDEKKAVSLIQSFWFSHNDYKMSTDEAKEDLIAWTAKGHTLYLIKRASEIIGFAHMGSRGCEADVVYYDEATSAIDPIGESFILKKMLELTEGRTTFIVTHRLAVCPRVDRVILLEHGRVAASGSHRELLKSSCVYRDMYEAQSDPYL